MEIMFTEPMVRTLMRLAYSEGVQGCEELGDLAVGEILQEVVGLQAEAKTPPRAAVADPMRGRLDEGADDAELNYLNRQMEAANARQPRRQQPAGVPANRPRRVVAAQPGPAAGYPNDDMNRLQQRADGDRDWDFDGPAVIEEPIRLVEEDDPGLG